MLPSTLLLALSPLAAGFEHFERSASARIDVSGAHAFVEPGATDLRGPCPGLNALANHNYISHDGIVHLTEVIGAVTGVWNMGIDLATVITLIAVVWAGDPVSLRFSIGGADERIGAPLGGLLGLFSDPQGIDQSHGVLESDASVCRNDLYQFGDAWTVNTTLFQGMMDLVPEGTPYTFKDIGDLAENRLKQTIAEDPNMYYGPYSGFIARNAGICFLGRLFANYSSGGSDATISHDILRSLFGMQPGNTEYKVGWDRIPENLYRRPTPYTFIDLNVDLLTWFAEHPQLGSIGGNMGQVNTFTPIDLSDPVHGLEEAPKLLEGNNLVCFALQLLKVASPSFLANIYKTLEAPLQLLDEAFSYLSPLGCPAWGMLTRGGRPIWEYWQKLYPGANQVPI